MQITVNKLFLWLLFKSAFSNSARPNFILILTDDLGYEDVGFNCHRDECMYMRTPNIDSLAANGVQFTQAYSAHPLCAPSRAGLLTGRYPDSLGFPYNPSPDPHIDARLVPEDILYLQEYLDSAGYHNGLIGKWHLGTHNVNFPTRNGFHEFYGFLTGGREYFKHKHYIDDLCQVGNRLTDPFKVKLLREYDRVTMEEDYVTDQLSMEALKFIDNNHDKPFFLFLSYSAPHGPYEQAPQEYLDRFPDVDYPNKIYAAMMSAVDDGVGNVLSKLQDYNIEENTVIFFTNDNGAGDGRRKVGKSNYPLYGSKSTPYEGGVRVPFAMQYKGTIPAGQVFEELVISFDIYKTISAIVGTPVEGLDGTNLLPYVTGSDVPQESPHSILFWRNINKFGSHEPSAAVREGDFKYLHWLEYGSGILIDLASGYGEHEVHGVQDQWPQEYNRLRGLLLKWMDSLPEIPRFPDHDDAVEWFELDPCPLPDMPCNIPGDELPCDLNQECTFGFSNVKTHCGHCRALTQSIAVHRTCDDFCAAQGRSCVFAGHHFYDTCWVASIETCSTNFRRLGDQTALCECSQPTTLQLPAIVQFAWSACTYVQLQSNAKCNLEIRYESAEVRDVNDVSDCIEFYLESFPLYSNNAFINYRNAACVYSSSCPLQDRALNLEQSWEIWQYQCDRVDPISHECSFQIIANSAKCNSEIRYASREVDGGIADCVNFYWDSPNYGSSGFINYRDGGCVYSPSCSAETIMSNLEQSWEIWEFDCTDPGVSTAAPTKEPSMRITGVPIQQPTTDPSICPTYNPTEHPSLRPTTDASETK